MGFVYRKPQSLIQKIQAEMLIMREKLRELWGNNLAISNADVLAILAGTYISSGTDGEGETNGVPTDADIEKILNGTYTHKDYPLDDYAPDSTISDEDIEAIINS